MARLESRAIAGYYKTPVSQLARIAGMLRVEAPAPDEDGETDPPRVAVCDPCAGDGEAIVAIARLIQPAFIPPVEPAEYAKRPAYSPYGGSTAKLCDAKLHSYLADEGCPNPACEKYAAREIRVPKRVARLRKTYEKAVADCDYVDFYVCELETSRYEALKSRIGASHNDDKKILHGDACLVAYDVEGGRGGGGVSLLFLNPPYDEDARQTGARLPAKFVDRFASVVASGGTLALVVPHYDLAACADTIGRMFDRITCYRLADGEYDAFKQVVLFARRREVDLRDPDPAIIAQLAAWDTVAPEAMLPDPGSVPDADRYDVPTRGQHDGDALPVWAVKPVDVTAIVQAWRPWHESRRRGGKSADLAPVARVLPDGPLAEMMHRTYEVATSPRPAHIAAGIAAGIFNGSRIAPNDPVSGLSDLLVKGVFDREWRNVEEKKDKKGNITSVVQVQAPKLVVSVLDMRTHLYHTLKSSVDRTESRDVAEMGIADLIAHYGDAMLAVMDRQCCAIYDPRRPEDAGRPICSSDRQPYAAQAHAVRALDKILDERSGYVPILDGEVGVGKSIIALLTSKTFQRAKRVLVTCPPHLLDGWRNEVSAVFPEAEVRVLSTPTDVDAIAEIPSDQRVVMLLTREAAKLGYGWESVRGGVCPRCGAAVAAGDHAKKRARCEAVAYAPANAWAKLARRLALAIRPSAPEDSYVRQVLDGRLTAAYAEKTRGRKPVAWAGVPADLARDIRAEVASTFIGEDGLKPKDLAVRVFAAAPDEDAAAAFVPIAHKVCDYGRFSERFAAVMLSESRYRTVAATLPDDEYALAGGQEPKSAAARVASTVVKARSKDGIEIVHGGENTRVRFVNGVASFDGHASSSLGAALALLQALIKHGAWSKSAPCGEPLFQAVPEPRRVPLSEYIAKRRPDLHDFMVADEVHEYGSSDSAQTIAVHRLIGLGKPAVMMTGSFLNGYARSAFANLRMCSPAFREEFDRGDEGEFAARYGYKKRVLTDKDLESGEVVAFGSQTDRVERCSRDAGDAPGVLPLLLFRHFLPVAVTIHKADLKLDLPECKQIPVAITAGEELHAEYRGLLKKLKDQMVSDRFEKDRAGKLFGQLSELPSFLDRATADVGNRDGGGSYEIRYPEGMENEKLRGKVVAIARAFPTSDVLPKEAEMLDTVERELAEGRNCMVLAWHLALLPRLQQLLEARLGEPCPILWADKVPTAKRQAWIDREIIKKSRRVMIANPVCIQTGLNNLVHFSTQWWHENPACNPLTHRQGIGRVDRIGQTKETRIYLPYYEGTLQVNCRDLLLAKVAVSTAVDGLDPTAALMAAGIGDETMFTGLSIGKQLWKMIEDEVDNVVPIDRAAAHRAATAG